MEQSWTQSIVNELWHMICTWRKILFPFLSLTLRAIWCVCVCVYICIYVCMYVYIFKNIFHLVVSFPFFLRKNLFRLFELSLYTSNLQICSPIRFSFFLSFFLFFFEESRIEIEQNYSFRVRFLLKKWEIPLV